MVCDFPGFHDFQLCAVPLMKTVLQGFQIEECCLAVPCSGRALFFRQKTMRKLRRRRADISHSFRIEYRWRLRHHWYPGKRPWPVHVPNTICARSCPDYIHTPAGRSHVCSLVKAFRDSAYPGIFFPPCRSDFRNHRSVQHRGDPQLYP